MNLGESRVNGVEMQGEFAITRSLHFGVRAAYTDYKITKLLTDPASGLTEEFLRRTVKDGLPKYSFGFNLNYAKELSGNNGTIKALVAYDFKGRHSMTPRIDGPGSYQDAFGLLSANIAWERVAGSPFDIDVFATNITNIKFAIGGAIVYNTLGFNALHWGEPRMYGLKARLNF